MSLNLRDSNLHRLIQISLEEDKVTKDVTTNIVFEGMHVLAKAEIYSKDLFVLCGIELIPLIIELSNLEIDVKILRNDGELIKPNDILVELMGQGDDLLSLERTFLNFLQRLSAIATSTRKFVEIEPQITVYDTRKTTPGYRLLEKYATKVGGATNHRFDLQSQILLKNNHIDLINSTLYEVLEKIFDKKSQDIRLEVEVRNIEELMTTLKFPVDIIMLDNFSNENIKKAIKQISSVDSSILVEVSGGIDSKRMLELKELGVKAVSTSKLITEAKGIDISMRIFRND